MTVKNFLVKNYGDKAFLQTAMKVSAPLIVSQLITTFVSMLDNIMVGQLGTLQMSGVSIANQLILIFTLAIFGSVGGASIFGAQFFGKKDYDGVRDCLQLKFCMIAVIIALSWTIFAVFGENLVHLYLNNAHNSAQDIVLTSRYAMSYIHIIMFSFLPFAITVTLSSGFREAGMTKIPMFASIVAVATNFCFNFILIFGHLGFPKLGSDGAAIATLISRIVEMSIIIFMVYRHKHSFSFFNKLFHKISFTKQFAKKVIIRAAPLMINEVLWSTAIAAIAQCYSTRGIDAVAAYNIVNTVENLFFVYAIAMGDTILILVGQKLGAGLFEEAKLTDHRLLCQSFTMAIFLGIALFFTSDLFPLVYNTDQSVQALASTMLKVCGACLWIGAVYNVAYFTMRSGGKTIITFLFDSVGTLCVTFSSAWLIAHFTNMNVVSLYFFVHIIDLYKVILGLYLIKKGVWIHNLTHTVE